MKKGFTLIELLAVISLVLVVTVSSTIGIAQMTNNNSENEYNKQIDKLKLAAKIYVHEQSFYKLVVYNDQNSTNGQCIYLKTLMDYNLISPNLVDPRTNSIFDETAKIRVKYVPETGTLSYDYLDANVSCVSDVVNVIDYNEVILLSDAIKRDNPEYKTQVVANDTMFQRAGTTNMGLWTENRAGKTENDLPVYFYRGDINNNYVSFAGKMWRIVRINEDGSVKLILGGNTTTDGYGGTTFAYNENSNLTDYVDYNHKDNKLRAANEEWYSNDTKGNLDEYESYIADTKFCNDKTVSSISGSTIYFGGQNRIKTNQTPQYKCPNASDNYIYKIGALTADEVVYAGGLFNVFNSSYYLSDNAQINESSGFWWLLSPSYYVNRSVVFLVYGNYGLGKLLDSYVDIAVFGFRPVISLKSTTLVSGKGTKNKPYVVQ